MDGGARLLTGLAALLGAAGVAIGAWSAHGAADARAAELLGTAAQYAVWHALAALIALLGTAPARTAATAFLLGVPLFGGSLVVLAFGGPRIFGAVAPFGGLAFIVGWLLLAWTVIRRR